MSMGERQDIRGLRDILKSSEVVDRVIKESNLFVT